jgi:hypothetical protein
MAVPVLRCRAREPPPGWAMRPGPALPPHRLPFPPVPVIGQKLFVSPRTVSTHLYRTYPKLGISDRDELAPALEAAHRARPHA